MRQSFYCLNCAVAIILVINSVLLASAPFFSLSRVLKPPPAPEPLDVSKEQFQINKYLRLGKELKDVEDWAHMKTYFNFNRIILLRSAGETKEERKKALSFQAKFKKNKWISVKLQKIPVTFDKLRKLCKSKKSKPKLLIGFDTWELSEVYRRKLGCVVAMSGLDFLEHYKLWSVPILTRPELDTLVTKKTQENGEPLKIAQNLVEGWVESGVKAVVVVFKDTVIPGNRLDVDFPDDFKKFAGVMHDNGLLLYIQDLHFERLEEKFSNASISAKFIREIKFLLMGVAEAKSEKEIVLIDNNIDNVRRAVIYEYLAIHSAGQNGFELRALRPPPPLPPSYRHNRLSVLHSSVSAAPDDSPLSPY